MENLATILAPAMSDLNAKNQLVTSSKALEAALAK